MAFPHGEKFLPDRAPEPRSSSLRACLFLLKSLVFPHHFIVRLHQPTALFEQFLHRFDNFLHAILIHEARFYLKAIDRQDAQRPFYWHCLQRRRFMDGFPPRTGLDGCDADHQSLKKNEQPICIVASRSARWRWGFQLILRTGDRTPS